MKFHGNSGSIRPVHKVVEAFVKNSPQYKLILEGKHLTAIVNMPHGALLVSKRVVELIKKDKKLHGYKFLDVIDQKGTISNRLFELSTDKIILLPDNLSDEGAICPVCGTELLVLTTEFAIRIDRLEGSSFFSRRPSGLASIYISNELYHFLKSKNIRGLSTLRGIDLIND